MDGGGRRNASPPTPPDAPRPGKVPRSLGLRIVLGLAAALVFLALIGLGTWQVERLAWKEDLVARVEANLAAAPVEAPGAVGWTGLDGDAYRRVGATGTFLHARETLVQAATALGAGYWVMTPLRRADGSLLLVNRGFVPTERRDPATRAAGQIMGETSVSGLLRLTEPGGGFLRANDPAAGRWYSRDVAAIAERVLPGETVAPYFVDADGTPVPGGLPVGGLTVVAFRNHHLVYAVTWYALAALLAGAMVHAVRDERRRSRAGPFVSAARPFAGWFSAGWPFAGWHGRLGRLFRPTIARPATPAPADQAGRKNLLLLIQLRWFAVAGQILSILVVRYGFGSVLPLQPMAGVIAALVTLNLVSLVRLYRRKRVTNAELFVSLVLDVLALTVQLHLSGGADNPFAPLYLLQVTVGAVLLDARWTGALVGLAILCFAGLTRFYRPLDLLTARTPHMVDPQTLGLLICFVLNTVLLVVFVTRINRNARERDERLAFLRQRAAEEDHIVRMGLLASGAAHELGTPLSTLSIILGDWRRMPQLTADPELSAEIDAMRAEVARCKSIVTGVLLAAGEARGESAAGTTLLAFLDGLAADWHATRPQAGLAYENRVDEDLPIVAESTLRQGVFNVLDNAFEVSPDRIVFTASQENDMLVLAVSDAGPGFSPEILAQIGRPYQSTKDRRAGGLGLFLVFNVVRKLGGTVSAANRPGGGAEIAMRLPLASLVIDDDMDEDEDEDAGGTDRHG